MIKERRHPRFTETLSKFMVIIAAVGAAWVLVDPELDIDFGWVAFHAPGGTFSNDLKGSVITAILIGGWTAVKEYWLGASAGGQQQQESLTRIAEGATPPKVDDVDITAQGNVTITPEELK